MTTEQPIRILVVDDHDMLASALGQVLDAEPDMVSVGIAPDLARARGLIRTTTPDVVLLDHRLPDGDGVAALPELRALRPSAHFVVLTASTADSVLVAAIEGGAAGFLSKTRGLAEITNAVRAAALGEAVISPGCSPGCCPGSTAGRPRGRSSPTVSARRSASSPTGCPTP